MNHDIARRRLHHQRLAQEKCRTPADAVSWLGAVQAQEYGPARWGLALRLPGSARDDAISRAFDRGSLLRTHVLRPTWHFVTPADIRWMLALTGPRVQARMAPYDRRLELDSHLFTRAAAVFERALEGGRHLTRQELRRALHERSGIDLAGQRLAHVVMYAELEGIVCSGPRRDKQFTYALVAERAPRARRLARDESLALLTKRYFRSHGPATVRDFVWWSGLTTADAKRGLEMNRAGSEVAGSCTYWSLPGSGDAVTRAQAVHLLPIYDEYVIAYRDRVVVPHASSAAPRPRTEAIVFQHALVIGGQVAGTWRTAERGGRVDVAVIPLRRLTRQEQRDVEQESARYARFLGVPVTLSIASS